MTLSDAWRNRATHPGAAQHIIRHNAKWTAQKVKRLPGHLRKQACKYCQAGQMRTSSLPSDGVSGPTSWSDDGLRILETQKNEGMRGAGDWQSPPAINPASPAAVARKALRAAKDQIAEVLAPILLYRVLIQRVAITILVMALLRLGSYIPLKACDGQLLKATGPAFGGSGTLFHLGIGPLVVVQLAYGIIDKVWKLPVMQLWREQGAEGQYTIQQVINIGSAIVAFGMGLSVAGKGMVTVTGAALNTPDILCAALSMTAGSVIIRFLSTMVDSFGIGDGVGWVICINVIVSYGHTLGMLYSAVALNTVNSLKLALALVMYGAMVTLAIKLNGVVYKLPMVYYKLRFSRGLVPGQQPYVRGSGDKHSRDNLSPRSYIPVRMIRGLNSLVFANYGLDLCQGVGMKAMHIGHLTPGSVSHTVVLALFIAMMELGPFSSNVEPLSKYLARIDAGIDGVAPGNETQRVLAKFESMARFWGVLGMVTILVGMTLVDSYVWGSAMGSPGLGLFLIVSEVTSAEKQVRALSQSPKIERRLQLQRKALESMMGGSIAPGPTM